MVFSKRMVIVVKDNTLRNIILVTIGIFIVMNLDVGSQSVVGQENGLTNIQSVTNVDLQPDFESIFRNPDEKRCLELGGVYVGDDSTELNRCRR